MLFGLLFSATVNLENECYLCNKPTYMGMYIVARKVLVLVELAYFSLP